MLLSNRLFVYLPTLLLIPILSACSTNPSATLDTNLSGTSAIRTVKPSVSVELPSSTTTEKITVSPNPENQSKTTTPVATPPSVNPVAKPTTTSSPKPTTTSSPKPTTTSSPKPTLKPVLPDTFEIGQEYPWEANPSRFGLAYTNTKPVQVGRTFAVFTPAPDQVLLVRADGSVLYRKGFLYTGVTGYSIVEGSNGLGFSLTCADGTDRFAQIIQYSAWTDSQHPGSFRYTPLYNEGNPCSK